MVDERGLLNGDTEDDFVEYVLKNVNNLRQCCFFSWQGGENMLQEWLSKVGACRRRGNA